MDPVLWLAYMLIVAGSMITITLFISGALASRAFCRRLFAWNPIPTPQPARRAATATASATGSGSSDVDANNRQEVNRRVRLALRQNREVSRGAAADARDTNSDSGHEQHSVCTTPARASSTSGHAASGAGGSSPSLCAIQRGGSASDVLHATPPRRAIAERSHSWDAKATGQPALTATSPVLDAPVGASRPHSSSLGAASEPEGTKADHTGHASPTSV